MVVREAPLAIATGTAEPLTLPSRELAMKFLPAWLSQLIGDAQFDATVDRVVHFAETHAWDRIAATAPALTTHAQRGYVRARTLGVVRDQVSVELRSKTVSQRYRNRLTAEVGQRLMARLLNRIQDTRQTLGRRAA